MADPIDATPNQFPSWPAWYYGPDGASQIFQSEDEVPDGWVDDPQKIGKKKSADKDKEAVKTDYSGKTDAEVIAELKKRNIEFGEKWPRPKLEALLVEHDKKGS